jgi:hypothetical protein
VEDSQRSCTWLYTPTEAGLAPRVLACLPHAPAQVLQAEKSAHREAAAAWSRKQQEMQVELATLRERAAGAEQRAADLAERLRRQEEQAEREIARLRGEQATTVGALRQLEAGLAKRRPQTDAKPQAARAVRGKKPSE